MFNLIRLLTVWYTDQLHQEYNVTFKLKGKINLQIMLVFQMHVKNGVQNSCAQIYE